MSSLYVSYRNADRTPSFIALSTALAERFGVTDIVKDATAFAGADYIATLESAIMSADLMLVVVGRHWLTVTNDAGQRRIAQANDVVQYEIARALALQKPLVVIRIDGVPPLTPDDLPAAIRALSQQPSIAFATSADLDQLTPYSVSAANVAEGDSSPYARLGLVIASIAGIVAVLTLCQTESTFLVVAVPYYLFLPHLLFLPAWVLGLFVAAHQRRWGWLAALAMPVIAFLLWSLWIFIQVVQSNVPGAGDFLLFPILGSYEAEGVVALLLIIFGLLVAGKLSFHWRA